MRKKIIYQLVFFTFFICQSVTTSAQENKPIRLSGVVLDAENQTPMPGVNVFIKDTRLIGTSSDLRGFFNLIINPGDTVRFTNVGYEDALLIIPLNIESEQLTLVQLLRPSTLELDEVVVFPWPNWNSFRKAFLETPDDNYNIEDLSIEVVRDLEKLSKEEYQRNKFMYQQMEYQRLYDLTGIVPPNNFLNPISWTNFIYELRKDK